jgi:DNA-binding NarL/FixJ family response regulator
MFGRGLESLLRQEANFDIIGQETDLELALDQIRDLQPDVVILDSDSAVPQVTPILRASPGVKVIGLSLQNNDLYVYQARQWIARGTEDHVSAIRDDLPGLKNVTRKKGDRDQYNTA